MNGKLGFVKMSKKLLQNKYVKLLKKWLTLILPFFEKIYKHIFFITAVF